MPSHRSKATSFISTCGSEGEREDHRVNHVIAPHAQTASHMRHTCIGLVAFASSPDSESNGMVAIVKFDSVCVYEV